MFISSLLTCSLFLFSSVYSQDSAATPDALTIVDQQYQNSGFASNSLTGFGVSLNATALLFVRYPNVTINNGAAYTVFDVSVQPVIDVLPSTLAASTFSSQAAYTLILADAASLGDPDVQGNYRHYLANGLTGSPGGSSPAFVAQGGTVITSYAAPGPIAGTGPHRYAWLFFIQPSTFSPPSNLSTIGTAPGHWNVSSYVQETGIQLVAASFFTVENGTPTGSVFVSAFNTGAITSSTTGLSTASSSLVKTTVKGSSTTTAAAASSTTSKTTGAASNSRLGGPLMLSVGLVVALTFIVG